MVHVSVAHYSKWMDDRWSAEQMDEYMEGGTAGQTSVMAGFG